MTWPSLRTNWVVATPTLAVCGAIGLPTSAPSEFSDGNSSSGACSRVATVYWKWPNNALDDVLLPDSATATQPRIGEMTTNQVPRLENPLAIELPMPLNVNTAARPKISGPTSSAPHIWRSVLL